MLPYLHSPVGAGAYATHYQALCHLCILHSSNRASDFHRLRKLEAITRSRECSNSAGKQRLTIAIILNPICARQGIQLCLPGDGNLAITEKFIGAIPRVHCAHINVLVEIGKFSLTESAGPYETKALGRGI